MANQAWFGWDPGGQVLVSFPMHSPKPEDKTETINTESEGMDTSVFLQDQLASRLQNSEKFLQAGDCWKSLQYRKANWGLSSSEESKAMAVI